MLKKSKELFRRARQIMPSGVNSPVRYYAPYPFFVKRSAGGHIWDVDGRRIVDLCNGYGALLLGHGRREVISAVSRQIGHGTLYCAPTELEVELAELIVGNFPSMRQVRLVNTGSEATMTAIRLARSHMKKDVIVKFEGGYHGAHDSVLVKAGSGAAHRGISISEGGLRHVSRQTLVARYNDFEGIEAMLASNGNIAAVIVEPVMANMGLIPPSKNFLRHLRKVTSRHGVLLIFDEVVTGFRMSAGGAQQYFGIRPDITTLAKALGSGFAIAAVGGRRDIMERLAPAGRVYQASTFAGNPVATAAAISSIKTINRLGQGLYDRLERYCAEMSGGISEIASRHRIPHHINRISSMMQIFFSKEPVTDYDTAMRADAAKFKRLFAGLLANNVFVPPSQFETVFLSAAHTRDDLSTVLEAYDAALRAVKG